MIKKSSNPQVRVWAYILWRVTILKKHNFSKVIILGAIGLWITACANNPIRSYKSDSDKMLDNISNGTVNTSVYGTSGNQDILYYMENGTYQRMQAQYENSNKLYAHAQKIVDIWVNSWKNTTSGQLTTSMTQMLINDNAVAYQPKGYEKTGLATYRALDHIDVNNWQNARVEIKKMYQTEVAIQNYNQALYLQAQADSVNYQTDQQKNAIYQQIISKYDFSTIDSPEVLALKNGYQSAFSHYLAGFVFEALGEPSLSRPGYINATKLNPNDQLSKISISNLDKGQVKKSGYTNLLIIEEVGHAPQYKSKQIPIVFNYNSSGSGKTCVNSVNLFFPELVSDPQGKNSYDYTIDNNDQTQELYTDYDLMAARHLHDQIPHLVERNIAAAIRNLSASQASCNSTQNNGDLGAILSIAASITGILLDRADERTWVLLPSKVYLNRVQLPYGTHTIRLNINGQSYMQNIDLNAPYQILDMRILGNKVFFMDQQ